MKYKNKFYLLFYVFFFIFFFGFFSVVYSQEKKDNNSGYIYHTSDKLFYDAKNKVFELTGNVNIFYSDTKIACDVFRYFEEKKYGKAEGNPRLFNPKVFIKSLFVEVFFDEKQVVAQKNVYVRLKNDNKEKKGEKNWDYFEVYTEKLVYNWQTQNVFIPTKLKIVSKDLYLTANQLVYNDKSKVLILKGDVVGQTKDQKIKAQKITYDLDKDKMTIEGNVKSVIKVSDKQEDKKEVANEKVKNLLSEKEIYQLVLKQNQKIIDDFIYSNGFVPTSEIYLNYYTKVEVYRRDFENRFIYDKERLKNSDIVFFPLAYRKYFPSNLLEDGKKKYLAYFVYSNDRIFFENYKESIDFVKSNFYGDDVILFSDPEDFSIVVFDENDKKKWMEDFLYETCNLSFTKGYYFRFDRDLYLLDLIKRNNIDKEVFFILDDSFWKGFDKNWQIVFSNYNFKVNIFIDMNSVKKFSYSPDEFFKFIFWQSKLHNVSVYINDELYMNSPYFKFFRK